MLQYHHFVVPELLLLADTTFGVSQGYHLTKIMLCMERVRKKEDVEILAIGYGSWPYLHLGF